ncbi:hypothetical protein A3750_08475 [Oleiphilus sp. HI0079]|uniref:glycosyltransferase n=1 Tax=Oleiphilus sp. HI0079 TaxID=1822254 RepID=UPI0007C254C9|nr:glycosyltransferase [Oleiphilus sp. HI0079]KZZ09847.1 hypothetical protein A3750_08475 [Oleiphilus sp. HI0079]
MSKTSLQTIKPYAKKCDADLVVIESFDSSSLPPMYAKTQIQNLLNEYDQVLFIDIDILITPKAPNLFKLFSASEDVFAAVPVERFFPDVGREKRNLSKALGEIAWTNQYFNSGVMLIGKNQAHIVNSNDGLIERWHQWKINNNQKGLNDQSVFNYRLNLSKTKLEELDRKFNFTRANKDFYERFNSYFIHYAGLRGNRTTLMELDYRVIMNSITYSLYIKLPLLCRIRDAFVRRYFNLG